MVVRAIGSADAYAAVRNVKKSVSKKFDLGVSLKVPKELAEKREYMQSKEFLNDVHNERMFDVIDEIMKYRDEIGKEIDMLNNRFNGKLVQAVNGYARIKSVLKLDYTQNFSNNLTISTEIETQYKLLKNILLKTLSKNAFKK